MIHVNHALVEACVRDGYVMIPGAFTETQALEARAEIDRMHGECPLIGRSEFEGCKTNCMWALLGKSREFDAFCLIPEGYRIERVLPIGRVPYLNYEQHCHPAR